MSLLPSAWREQMGPSTLLYSYRTLVRIATLRAARQWVQLEPPVESLLRISPAAAAAPLALVQSVILFDEAAHMREMIKEAAATAGDSVVHMVMDVNSPLAPVVTLLCHALARHSDAAWVCHGPVAKAVFEEMCAQFSDESAAAAAAAEAVTAAADTFHPAVLL